MLCVIQGNWDLFSVYTQIHSGLVITGFLTMTWRTGEEFMNKDFFFLQSFRRVTGKRQDMTLNCSAKSCIKTPVCSDSRFSFTKMIRFQGVDIEKAWRTQIQCYLFKVHITHIYCHLISEIHQASVIQTKERGSSVVN